ncbi:cytochrome bd ubiquinol oxidase related protein [Thermoplasma acidophilum]|uniref:Cytochrome bd ubiquinol oxidase related protein n=1 Tax=Thermoplasma acidophilum (strain ATCC 25905 / DSM 1728 / JCM 9062 / NBRC 15155 / AMRC-C165) TaxID=273075 RepID=Q9HJH6_THEAC|nr:cytochrome ubiquinol oxidase subunit I [Thermoplasma acidophilum]CAC12121.1 cytochrome bd ubiquinol oxidase related protein [Thermoplasma acidophilum]
MNIGTFDRLLFAYSIGSHILIVLMSIGLSVILPVLEYIAIKYKDAYYDILTRRVAKALVMFFAVGTASGAVMAVELIDLFPKFMTVIAVVGVLPFYYEIFAFFLETIMLVSYYYYWDVFKNRMHHWLLTFGVAGGTLGSAVFITMINAWMNTPNGFNISYYEQTGKIIDVNPFITAMTPSTGREIFHVAIVTAFSGLMVLGAFFAYQYIRSKTFEEKNLWRKGLKVTFPMNMFLIIMAGISGTLEMSGLLTYQPEKYAALDLDPYPVAKDAPEHIFGTIVEQNGHYVIVGGFKIPLLQSLLAGNGNLNTPVPGLSQFNPSTWPPLAVHDTFDLMVLGGSLLGLYLFVTLIAWILKKKPYENKGFLVAQILFAILTIPIYIGGWVTDEVGRQPWIIYNVMTVYQAANYSPSIVVPGYLIMAFYTVIMPFSYWYAFRLMKKGDVKSEVSSSGFSAVAGR